MEARAAREGEGAGARLPTWLLGLLPLALIAAAAIAFAVFGAPGLGDRTGPPVEDVAVERTVLRPGEIELTLRNDGRTPSRSSRSPSATRTSRSTRATGRSAGSRARR